MWRLPSTPKRWFTAGICLLLYLAATLPSRAESSLTFLPLEESKYLLKGEEFEGIAAITFTVDYDTTYLSAPDVVVMGGKLLEEDRGASTPPGNLQLHILNEDHNAVFEATIYFQKNGDYPAVINFVTAEVTDMSGAQRPMPVKMVAPVYYPQSGEVPAVTTPASVPVALSSEGVAVRSTRDGGATTEGLSPVAPPIEAPAASTPPLPQMDHLPPGSKRKAVFQRFREFAGKKGLAAYTALFSGSDNCCRQTPPLLVADGRRTARVVFSDVAEGDGPPLFTVSGGRLLSVERGTSEKEWIALVRPDARGWDVWVSCSTRDGTIDFPLTVAPPIDIPQQKLAELNEKTFLPRLRSFLAGKTAGGKAKLPVWLREYLFTANYLAARGERLR